MKNHSSLYFLFFIFWVGTNVVPVPAYDEKRAHPKINRLAAINSKLHTMVQNQLGMSGGLDAILLKSTVTGTQSITVLECLTMGGKEEDAPFRYMNHFHDPLMRWESAGLASYTSSLVWAQKFLMGDGRECNPECDGYGTDYNAFSWESTKNYYYRALRTGSDMQWAKTFRALGQVMHLLADAAVPAHVRNDPHLADPYEKWVADPANFDNLQITPITIDPSIFSHAVMNASAPCPISALWDQDIYTGENPSDAFIGLAEYTNANFLSNDTLFKDYPHPSLADTDFVNIDELKPEWVTAEDGKTEQRAYAHHNAGGKSYTLAAFAYLTRDCLEVETCYSHPLLIRDEKVHHDYAEELLPRAIGYNAALIEYFFRGKITVLPAANGVYALYAPRSHPDVALPDAGFGAIRLQARNNSPDGEEMANGAIELVVKYKVAASDPFVTGHVDTGNAFSYIVAPESTGRTSIPGNEFVELTFNLPGELPLYATDVYLYVVFRGRLGAEENAVAVGFKDVSEPTPYEFFNNMDWVCVNGAWKVAGGEEAVQLADAAGNSNGILDSDEWDVFPHKLNALSVHFFPGGASALYPPPADFGFDTLEPDRSDRVFVIGDEKIGYGMSPLLYSSTGSYASVDQCRHGYWPQTARTQLPTVKRQTDIHYDQNICNSYGLTVVPCEIEWMPMYYDFRGKPYWALRHYHLTFPYGGVACSYIQLPRDAE